MVALFPQVHSLLVILSALQDEDVDGARVCDVAVTFKPLSDGMAVIGW